MQAALPERQARQVAQEHQVLLVLLDRPDPRALRARQELLVLRERQEQRVRLAVQELLAALGLRG